MVIRKFEDLESWQLARELTKQVYAVSAKGAFGRDFELRSQIRAASGSVMHNCAEGFGAGSNAEFVRFLRFSQRPCTEVQSQLYVALDQVYLNQLEFDQLYWLAGKVNRCIGGLIRYLKANPAPKPSIS